MPYTSLNPATGEKLNEYPTIPPEELLRILEKMHTDFLDWRNWSFEQRAACFNKLAAQLRERVDECAKIMVREIGKPVSQGRAEILKCAGCCEYFAEHAEAFLKDEPVESDSEESFITHQPLGIILGIMPWNFPFWQVIRASVPAMMAGNAFLLKHAPNVPECALTLEAMFHEAGFPTHCFRNVMIETDTCAFAIVDARVQGITLTGSVKAGQAIATQSATQLKKVVLELGGTDPYLILHDADISHAAKTCAQARMQNCGQTCIAAKRLIVVPEVADKFVSALKDELSKWEPGDPAEEETTLGPMAREDLRDTLHHQVAKSIDAGATLLLGGEKPMRTGAWYPPTLLDHVTPGMSAFNEELFGPVASVVRAEDETHAIALANASPYGLGAAIFSKDLSRARKLARTQLQAGFVAINDFVRSDPRLPFGGIKMSGLGRELGSVGIKEFVNTKSVTIS